MQKSQMMEGQVEIERKIIKVQRKDLREEMKRRGIEWVDDKRKENIEYERKRVRMGVEEEEEGKEVMEKIEKDGEESESENEEMVEEIEDKEKIGVDEEGMMLINEE